MLLLNTLPLLYSLFSLEKRGILILYQSLSIVRLSVYLCLRLSITFLVNTFQPQPLDVETLNFVSE